MSIDWEERKLELATKPLTDEEKHELEARAGFTAWEAQDSCNFVAVVNAMGRCLSRLRQAKGMGESEIRKHPVARAFVDKLVSMCGQWDRYGDFEALNQCKKWHQEVEVMDGIANQPE